MGGTQTSPLLFKDKPIFGLDVGFSTVKVMQIEQSTKKARPVIGYGVSKFNNNAILDGELVDLDHVAHTIAELFESNIIGNITTRRVAVSIPSARTFTKTITLPSLPKKEIDEAVLSELSQYISIPLEDLYSDYSVINESKEGIEILSVSIPKTIVNSYLQLLQVLGLEPVLFDTSIGAAGRLFGHQGISTDIPSVLIDFGSLTADITIYDKTVIVTSTASCGGDIFTDLIAKKLKVTKEEASLIKGKYGLGKSKKQNEIVNALSGELENLVREIRRMIRYFEDRSEKNDKIGQIITMGGGANMPGLSDHLTSTLRLPVRTCDPWTVFDTGRLRSPKTTEKAMFVTAFGLALVNPKEIYK